MSYFFRWPVAKWDETKVNRGKTTPESNEGSFAPLDKINELSRALMEYAPTTSVANVSKDPIRERVVLVNRHTGQVVSDYEQTLLFDATTPNWHYKQVAVRGEDNEFVGGHADNSLIQMHTHPTDTDISDGDWRVFMRSHYHEMRVYTPAREIRLTKTPEFVASHWSERTPAKIGALYDELQNEVFEDLAKTPLINTPGDAFVDEVIAQTSARLAAKLGLLLDIRPYTPPAKVAA